MRGNELPAHRLRGQLTRRRVLEHTVDLARREGLEALTIGRVAEGNAITKAGLLGHFPSKADLQLSTVDAGRAGFIADVVAPASGRPEGIERLGALLRRWIDHGAQQPGGCFIASIAAEFDARPGAVRDRIAAMVHEWLQVLEGMIRRATRIGEIKAGTDARRLAFELHGYELSMNLRAQLLGDEAAAALAATAMRSAVLACASRKGRIAFERGWADAR
jgi:AcrR family transcriptional regulator